MKYSKCIISTILILQTNLLLGYECTLAVCAIFKDCAPYLKEWIEFHRMLGVEHFYLYNNSSSDDPHTILANYVLKDIVTVIEWPNRGESHWGDHLFAWVNTTQIPAYNHALRLAIGRVKWIAFIDTDEFIVPVNHQNILSFLKSRKNDFGISIRWQVYGTSNVYDIPENHLMVELLTKKCKPDNPINNHTKMIVKPEKFIEFKGPHKGIFKNNTKPYIGNIDEIRINHYINRTVNFFFNHKIKNKETMDNSEWSEATIEHWLNLGNEVEDHLMDRFIPELKKRMGFI